MLVVVVRTWKWLAHEKIFFTEFGPKTMFFWFRKIRNASKKKSAPYIDFFFDDTVPLREKMKKDVKVKILRRWGLWMNNWPSEYCFFQLIYKTVISVQNTCWRWTVSFAALAKYVRPIYFTYRYLRSHIDTRECHKYAGAGRHSLPMWRENYFSKIYYLPYYALVYRMSYDYQMWPMHASRARHASGFLGQDLPCPLTNA